MLDSSQENINKPRLKRALAIGALTASLFGGTLISSGLANALYTDPNKFLNKIGQLTNGDITSKDFIKFIIDNSGKGEVCQQAGRQSGEAIIGDSSVYDPLKGMAGYLLNNERMCTLGLTGLDINDLDEIQEIPFTEGFPVFPGFDRNIIDGTAYYYIGSNLVGTSRILDSSIQAQLISGSEYLNIINDVEAGYEQSGVIASGQPMPTGHELGLDQRIPYPIYDSANMDLTPELWTTQGIQAELPGYNLPITEKTIINNPDFIVFSYDGQTYDLGTLTDERINSVNSNNGFYFVSTFNVTPTISIDNWLKKSLSVYKVFPSILLANVNSNIYLLQVTGDAYGDSGSVIDTDGVGQSTQALFLTLATSLGRQGTVAIFDDAQANFFVSKREDGELVFQYCLGNKDCYQVHPKNPRRENMFNPNNPAIMFSEK